MCFFKVLHVLKFTNISTLHLGKFMFSHLPPSTSTTPLLVGNVLNHNVHQYETRNQHRIHIEYARLKLPPHLTECLTKGGFLNRLEHELLASY